MKEKKGVSVTQSKGGFTVAPSPFNPVKLDLGVILVFAVVLGFTHGYVSDDPWVQLALLAGYGFFAMLWLIVRVRRIAACLAATGKES